MSEKRSIDTPLLSIIGGNGEMRVLELLYDVDDVMLSFAPQWKPSQLAAGTQASCGPARS